MQKALFFILAIFVINRVSSCSAIYCYDSRSIYPHNWKEVECNLGSCVKKQGPQYVHRYCLQGIIMNTCSNDNVDVMSVSLQTIKTKLTIFFVLYRVLSQKTPISDATAILTCAMDL